MGSRKRKANEINTGSSTDTDDISIEHEPPTKKRKLTRSDSLHSHQNNNNNETLRMPSTRDFIQFDIRSWAYMDNKGPYKSHIKLTNNETASGGLKTFDLQ